MPSRSHEHDPEHDWRRAAARRALVPLAVVIAGLLVAALTSGTWEAVGFGIFGVGAVLAVSLFFLEVGYSEDRERARRPPPRGGSPTA